MACKGISFVRLERLGDKASIENATMGPSSPGGVSLASRTMGEVSTTFIMFLTRGLNGGRRRLIVSIKRSSEVSTRQVGSSMVSTLSFFNLRVGGYTLTSAPTVFVAAGVLNYSKTIRVATDRRP